MVKIQSHNNQRRRIGGPPPIDESWWEAVLTEEDGEVIYSNPVQALPVSLPAQPATSQVKELVDWQYAFTLFREDRSINLQVTGYNKGGLLVSGDKLQGFVPVSHLVDLPLDMPEDEPEPILITYLNRLLRLKVIECDQKRGRVVFSERAALADSGVRNKLFSQLKPGDCTQGIVTNVTDFGAFVDLGGVEGLVHVSEISWGRVRHPADIVKVGDQVQVYVINVDPERSRIALSLKRLCQNPWDTAEVRYYPGQVIEAVITSVVPYGAFARLEEGLDGLIHITDISRAEEMNEFQATLSEGQRVQVRVLHVDATKQRLGLSLQIDV